MRTTLFCAACCLCAAPLRAETLTIDFDGPLPVGVAWYEGLVAGGRLNNFDVFGVGLGVQASGEIRLVSLDLWSDYEYERYGIAEATGVCTGSSIHPTGRALVPGRPADVNCVQPFAMGFYAPAIEDDIGGRFFQIWADNIVFEYTGHVGHVGDTNIDGVVDLTDLNHVRNQFGETGENLLGDDNRDGVVDLVDLNAVRNNFGATSVVTLPAAATVAEPSSAALGLLSLIALHIGRTGRCGSPRGWPRRRR